MTSTAPRAASAGSLPTHLLDALFYAQTGVCSTFEKTAQSRKILANIETQIRKGYTSKALQRLPHLTLLDKDFYAKHLKPAMAEWAYLWLQKQHLYGISRNEAVQYLVAGAAAKSQSQKRLTTLENAIDAQLVRQGEMSELPEPTAAHLRMLSQTSTNSGSGVDGDDEQTIGSDPAVVNFRQKSSDLMKSRKDEYHEDYSPDERRFFESKFLPQLEVACASAKAQVDAISAIIAYEASNEARAAAKAAKLAHLDGKMQRIAKEIEAIEFPRDDSMDNNIIVLLSSKFGDVGARASGGGSAAALSDDVVHKLCAKLEDMSFSVRRCSTPEECVEKSRELLLAGQLRCVVSDMGGRDKPQRCESCQNSMVNGGQDVCTDISAAIYAAVVNPANAGFAHSATTTTATTADPKGAPLERPRPEARRHIWKLCWTCSTRSLSLRS